MILANPYGGLGNQLFCYAFARMLAAHTNEHVYFSRSSFNRMYDSSFPKVEYFGDYFQLNPQLITVTNGAFSKELFRGCASVGRRIFTSKQETLTQNQFFEQAKKGYYVSRTTYSLCDNIKDIPTTFPVKYVEGLFQWPAFFESIREQLKQELSLKLEIGNTNKDALEKIQKSESICMHIRRGDYLKFPTIQVCNYHYYKQAMDYISQCVKNPTFYIFSDDIEWVKGNYIIPYPHRYIEEHNLAPIELELMKSCKHFIMSNSTFSWWAQYLSKNGEAVVIAPTPWFADGRKTSLYLPHWVLLKSSGGMDL